MELPNIANLRSFKKLGEGKYCYYEIGLQINHVILKHFLCQITGILVHNAKSLSKCSKRINESYTRHKLLDERSHGNSTA